MVVVVVVAPTIAPLVVAVVVVLPLVSTVGLTATVPMGVPSATTSCLVTRLRLLPPTCKAAAPTIVSGSRQPDKLGLQLN